MVMELKPAFLGVRSMLLATLTPDELRAVKAIEAKVNDTNVPEATRRILERELKVLDSNLGRLPENGGYPYHTANFTDIKDRIHSAIVLGTRLADEGDLAKALATKEAELKAASRPMADAVST